LGAMPDRAVEDLPALDIFDATEVVGELRLGAIAKAVGVVGGDDHVHVARQVGHGRPAVAAAVVARVAYSDAAAQVEAPTRAAATAARAVCAVAARVRGAVAAGTVT